MPKRLYEVTISMMVLSDDKENAKQVAIDNLLDIDDTCYCEAEECSSIPAHKWDSFPWTDAYDDDDDDLLTCGQIIERQRAEEKFAKAQMTLFPNPQRGEV